MDRKAKFIIIGLVGFCMVCLFLFIQSNSQQQKSLRENNDLKTENTTLASKAKKLEIDLKANLGKIDSLTAERDRVAAELNDLQGKFEAATAARDSLIEKLKQRNQEQVASPAPQPVQSAPQPIIAPANTDAYWGSVLKAKNELEMQLTEIRVELKNLQMINETLRKEKKKTEAEIRLEGQLVDVRAELKSLQIANESLQREKGLLEIDINNLRNEKKDILRQLDYNQKLLDNMSQEVVRERNDKLAIVDGFKTTKNDNGVLVRQLKSLVNRKTALDKKVQQLQGDKSSLEKRLNETEAMLADKSSKITTLKNELDTLKSNNMETGDKEFVELPAIVVRSTAAGTEKTKAQKEAGGKILAVNLDSNFVVMDLGATAGIKMGDVFHVYRDDPNSSIGTISVIQTRANISACDIKKMSTALGIGDKVRK